ncbi:hypothetical protein CFREI_02940 [Corynebacterium freiburgense]|nr:hypothetical protein CFREI_02940 [Corynebacterium freiburgense]
MGLNLSPVFAYSNQTKIFFTVTTYSSWQYCLILYDLYGHGLHYTAKRQVGTHAYKAK